MILSPALPNNVKASLINRDIPIKWTTLSRSADWKIPLYLFKRHRVIATYTRNMPEAADQTSRRNHGVSRRSKAGGQLLSHG